MTIPLPPGGIPVLLRLCLFSFSGVLRLCVAITVSFLFTHRWRGSCGFEWFSTVWTIRPAIFPAAAGSESFHLGSHCSPARRGAFLSPALLVLDPTDHETHASDDDDVSDRSPAPPEKRLEGPLVVLSDLAERIPRLELGVGGPWILFDHFRAERHCLASASWSVPFRRSRCRGRFWRRGCPGLIRRDALTLTQIACCHHRGLERGIARSLKASSSGGLR